MNKSVVAIFGLVSCVALIASDRKEMVSTSRGEVVQAAQPFEGKVLQPAYRLDSESYPNKGHIPNVYFYDDPSDTSRRCQTVTVEHNAASTTCWTKSLPAPA